MCVKERVSSGSSLCKKGGIVSSLCNIGVKSNCVREVGMGSSLCERRGHGDQSVCERGRHGEQSV